MKVITVSHPLNIYQPYIAEPIHLFIQFYLDANRARHKEIVQCLQFNTNNAHITQIHLLNERIYKPKELGVVSPKIVQVDMNGKRLHYSDVFNYIQTQSIQGYCIFANSDIFLDSSLDRLFISDLRCSRKMMAQLRLEYLPQTKQLSSSPIFGPRFDSQDTWILHSSQCVSPFQNKLFNFAFGKPGCDNKIAYLMRIINYEIINDPQAVKTYHYHTSNVRNYTHDKKEVIPMPWGVVVPYGYPFNTIHDSLGISLKPQHALALTFDDQTKLFHYVKSKLELGIPFVIPRISTIETELAHYGRMLKPVAQDTANAFFQELKTKRLPIMKNNAGIQISNLASLIKYSDMYLQAFENCDMYGAWDKQGHVYPCVAGAQDYIETALCSTKTMIWGFAFDIFHYIYHPTPWTHALRGKRILLVSAFEESIKQKLGIRTQIYDGVDLFPECTFLTIKPPQTQGGEVSREFDVELEEFLSKLSGLKGQYDVALVACGGYGSLVVNAIYQEGVPAIYVGGVLQMYFGILGSRWLRERPDIVRLFLNAHWSRPSAAEKPSHFEKVEGSCYW